MYLQCGHSKDSKSAGANCEITWENTPGTGVGLAKSVALYNFCGGGVGFYFINFKILFGVVVVENQA